jgi:hypothetical protein
MPYALKSTALTAKLVHCIAVDDNNVVKDFVGGSPVTMSWVDDANGAISGVYGAEQWRSATSNSSSHRYFHTSASRFVKFGVKPTFTFGGTNAMFLAFADIVRNESFNSSFLSDSSDNYIGAGGYAYWAASVGSAQCFVNTTHSTDGSTAYVGNSLTGQQSLAFVSNGATAVYAYLDGTDRTNAATDLTYAPDAAFQPGFIGGRGDGSVAPVNYLGAKMFCVAQFSDVLTTQEITDLNTDWFGTLFATVSTVRKLKCLIEPAAIGSTVRYGAVFAAPTGAAGSKVTGAKIGEFESVAFQTGSGADTGYAVLKVPVADFGGGALSTSDTPVVYLEDVDESTYPFPATVIDE